MNLRVPSRTVRRVLGTALAAALGFSGVALRGIEAISREVSILEDVEVGPAASDAISREVSILEDSVTAPGPTDAISREVSVLEDLPFPSQPLDSISREVSILEDSVTAPIPTDAISREVSVLEDLPFPSQPLDSISREVSILTLDSFEPIRVLNNFGSGDLRFEAFADTRPTNPLRRASPSTNALTFAGELSVPAGTIVNVGPVYNRPASTYPTVQRDTFRQLVLLHPDRDSTGASVAMTVPIRGRYLIHAAFARANNARNAGDGVSVAVIRNLDTTNLLFSAQLTSDAAVDADHPFAGTAVAQYNTLLNLDEAEQVRFVVFSGATSRDIDSDVTALESFVVLAEAANEHLTSTPPVLFVGETNVVASVGGLATLGFEAYGSQPMSFLWLHSGHEVPGAGKANLTLVPVKSGDRGDYHLVAANSAGSAAGGPIRLNVLEPPVVERPLSNLVLFPGNSTVLDAGVAGGAPIQYQWYRDNAGVAGATLAQLPLANVQASDTGIYSVVASNPGGRVTNGPVRIRVHSPVAFLQPLPPLTTLETGDELRLRAIVGGSGPFQFQWRLNGNDIPGETNDTYVVPHVELRHAGAYTVVVADEFGAVTSDPALVVIRTELKPAGDNFVDRVTLADNTGVVSGTTVNATIENGEPLHADKRSGHSVWYAWTAPADGQATFETTGSAFDTLLAAYTGASVTALTEVASNDDATLLGDPAVGQAFASRIVFPVTQGTSYAIVIAGFGDQSGGYALSRSFQPRLALTPRFRTHPSDATRLEGESVLLTVDVENAESIEWWLNGKPLPGARGNPLRIPSLRSGQVGVYTAVASGAGAAVASHPANVEIGPQPGVRSYDKLEEVVSPPNPGAASKPAPHGLDDAVAHLTVHVGIPNSLDVNNTTYTTDAKEPNHCGQLVRKTGSILITTPASEELVVSATSATVIPVMAIYEGIAFSNAPAVACSVGKQIRVPKTRANGRYTLVFGSTNEVGGEIHFEVNLGKAPPAVPPVPIVPVNTTLAARESITLAAPNLGPVLPAPSLQWYLDGRPIPGATGTNLVVTASDAGAAGRYTVAASNGIGTSVYTIANLDVDVPLASRTAGAGLGFLSGTFRFHVDGNAGQRIAVDLGPNPGSWSNRAEFWLPAGGLDYADTQAAELPARFYTARELPVTIVPEPPYTDGQRAWRVTGGRLGRPYILETSVNGTTWRPVATNSVSESAYLHIAPASATFRVR